MLEHEGRHFFATLTHLAREQHSSSLPLLTQSRKVAAALFVCPAWLPARRWSLVQYFLNELTNWCRGRLSSSRAAHVVARSSQSIYSWEAPAVLFVCYRLHASTMNSTCRAAV